MRASAPRQAKGRPAGPRVLIFELLEDRRMLDAGLAQATGIVGPQVAPVSPWHNSTLPLDVDGNGIVTAADALFVINRLLLDGAGPLPPPDAQHPAQYLVDTDGNGSLSAFDALLVINALINPPQVTLTTMVPFSVDVTPQLTVTATSPAALANGTMIKVDVDLNDNGNFTDPGETDWAMAPLFNSSATFELQPALPPSGANGPYTIRLRAHVTDSDGVQGYSPVQTLKIDTSMSDVLANYVNTPDPAYAFSLANTVTDPNGLYTVYNINMTSQTWRTSADVDRTVWQNWVQIIVPSGTIGTTALLLIDSGSNTATPPGVNQGLLAEALQSHTVTVDLTTVPNEPLTFTADPLDLARTEDQILAFSFYQYMQNIGQPGDDTWPVLLPMVKSAVRAMDTVQTFVPTIGQHTDISNFVVTGYSKRGWTTWLTAAVDPRVSAIIPGVYDNLNIAMQMVHHYAVYGFFSPAIQAYNDLHIFDDLLTPQGEDLSTIIDPYRYLNNGRFTIPKLMIDSAGDQFFVSDSAQYYIHDLPGTENYIRYLPNTDHSLDARAAASTASFYDALLNNRTLPQYSWVVEPDGSIRAQTNTAPTQVLLWQATNPTARDFRQDYNPGLTWTSSPLTDQGGGVYVGDVPMPTSGATAYFIEFTWPSAIPGNPYVFTTEIHVQSTLPLTPWPFAVGPDAVATPGAVGATSNAVAAGLAIQSFVMPSAGGSSTSPSSSTTVAASPASTTSEIPGATPSAVAATELLTDEASLDNPLDSTLAKSDSDCSDPALADSVFGSSVDDVLT